MCFLSVDFRLQMLMERSLLAIVSLMVFQIFEALFINCELGSGVIRKALLFCLIVGIKVVFLHMPQTHLECLIFFCHRPILAR